MFILNYLSHFHTNTKYFSFHLHARTYVNTCRIFWALGVPLASLWVKYTTGTNFISFFSYSYLFSHIKNNFECLTQCCVEQIDIKCALPNNLVHRHCHIPSSVHPLKSNLFLNKLQHIQNITMQTIFHQTSLHDKVHHLCIATTTSTRTYFLHCVNTYRTYSLL